MGFDKKNTAVWRFAGIFILFNCRKPGKHRKPVAIAAGFY